ITMEISRGEKRRQRIATPCFTLLLRPLARGCVSKHLQRGPASYGCFRQGNRAALRGGRCSYGGGRCAPGAEGAAGAADRRAPPGLVPQRCRADTSFRLAKTTSVSARYVHSDLPAQAGWRALSGRHRGAAFLADAGACRWMRVVRRRNRDAARVARAVD